MDFSVSSALQWLALAEHELLLFAGVFFLIGALDEFAVDVIFLWYRVTGRTHTITMPVSHLPYRRLSGKAAVLIPAWREDQVIGHTISHALKVWSHKELLLYIGCYRNDPATVAEAVRAAASDPRVRIVITDCDGPTTKACCLNRLYAAMELDEQRSGERVRLVLLHDAEDMVDPAALSLLDRAIELADFVQLPVLPVPQPNSRWVGSHYCEEFAEAHGKALVVRAKLSGSLPAAGVGCGFARDMLSRLAQLDSGNRPFSDESLTEDYELGLKIAAMGGRSRLLRVRGEDGRLVATRAYFPATLGASVRQKARWIHGIAFQGWDRLDWGSSLGERWMRLRDRRGPFSALVLACGYLLLLLTGASFLLTQFGFERTWEPTPFLWFLIYANLASFIWRGGWRFAFTARDYGWVEGVRAVLRIPFANVIAIMAARRAVFAYLATLRGTAARWDKTTHDSHPVRTAQLLLEAGR